MKATMSVNFNKLTPAETERLACMSEECGEVVQEIGKVLRHGYEDRSPHDPECMTNRQNLEKEMGDVLYWMIEMAKAKDVSIDNIFEYVEAKQKKVGKWLHHQGESKDV